MNKTVKKSLFTGGKVCFAFLFILLFSNCQIGLGAAIDVQPPTVAVTSPSADFIVRDTFTISGTYSDDMRVAKVTLSLKEVNTSEEYTGFTATVTPESPVKQTNGTWSCNINPSENGIKDGTYVVTVTAVDTFLHEGTATQTFSIDNTPPLIVLTSPSSISIENPTSYGQSFTLEGKAADDSDVDSIDAIIFDQSGNEIGRKKITSVSTQIEVSVANWGDELYGQIYGSDKEAGTKNYYIGIVAYDGARKNPAEEGDRGNSTSVFYLNNDMAELSGFKTSVAYKLLNGTRAYGEDTATWQTALTEKKRDKVAFSLNPVNNPYFDVQSYEPLISSVNLDNENYNFTNKNKVTVNLYVGRDKSAIKTETIGVYLKPCDVNGQEIAGPVVTLLAPYKDKDGNVIGEDKTSQITSVGSTSYRWSSDSLDADTISGLNIGSYYIFDVVAYDYNGTGIRNDNRYGIKITTTNAAPTISILSPGSTATIASSEAVVVKGSIRASADITSLKVCLNGDTDVNIINGLNLAPRTLAGGESIVNNPDGSTTITLLSDGLIYNAERGYYNFQVTVPARTCTDSSFRIVLIARDANNQTGSKDIEVSNDTVAPTFGENAFTPTVEKVIGGNTVQTVNGRVEITQNVTDNAIVSDTWYSVDDGASWVNVGKTNNMKFSVDTTVFTDNADKTIWLKAVDSSGNVRINPDPAVPGDPAKIVLHVDQSLDAPTYDISNSKIKGGAADYTLASVIESKYEAAATPSDKADVIKQAKLHSSAYGTQANRQILGTIYDDDGIKEVKAYYLAEANWVNGYQWPAGTTGTEITGLSDPGNTTSYNLKATLPAAEGAYLVKFEIKDRYCEDAGYPDTGHNKTTIGPYLIAVDDGAPELVITTASGADQYKGASFSISGTMNDKTATLEAYKDQACTIAAGSDVVIDLGTWDNVNLRYNWTATINGGTQAVTKSFWFQATDEYNQKTTKEYKFSVDPIPPRFCVTSIQGVTTAAYGYKAGGAYNPVDYTGYGNKTDYYTVKGEVKDNWDSAQVTNSPTSISGLGSYFYYYVGSTEPPKTSGHYTPSTVSGWQTCTIKQDASGYKWEAPVSFASFNNNDDLCIYFAAMDNAGNYTVAADNPSSFLKIKIDTQAPEIYGTPVLTQDASETKIEVLARDGETSIGSTSVWRNNVEYTLSTPIGAPVSETVVAGGVSQTYQKYKYVIKASDLLVGENKFVIKVKDAAGNEKTANEITINNNAPSFSNQVSGIPAGAYVADDYSYVISAFSTTAKVTCGAGNKLGEVEWKDIYDNGGTPVEIANGKTSNSTLTVAADGSFTISKPTGNAAAIRTAGYEGKQITRTITASNIYGQTSQWIIKFCYDVTAPVLDTSNSYTKIGGKDVSNVDFNKNWFNSTTLTLEGRYNEAGSGINKISYNQVNGQAVEVTTYATGSIYTTDNGTYETFSSNIGGFTEGVNKNVLRFKAKDKAGNESAVSEYLGIKIDTSKPKLVESTAPGAASGSPTATFWYRFAGETSWNKYESSILTNKKKSIEVTGSYKDAAFDPLYLQSGVKSIAVSINGGAALAAKAYTTADAGVTWTAGNFAVNGDGEYPAEGRWFISIPSTALGADGLSTAKVTVLDNADNSDDSSSFGFNIDTTAPSVSVETPSANDVLNRLNTISGKVTDTNNVKSIQLYYYLTTSASDPAGLKFQDFSKLYNDVAASSTELKKVVGNGGITLNQVTGWKFENVDFNKILKKYNAAHAGNEISAGNVYILPVGYDEAGNNNLSGTNDLSATTAVAVSNTTKVKVDMMSDRPVISFNSIGWDSAANGGAGGNTQYISATDLTGFITDDDGLKELRIAISSTPIASTPSGFLSNDAYKVSLSSGSFKKSLGTDGQKYIWMYIKDSADGAFETGKSSTPANINQPYVLFDGNAAKQNLVSAISFVKDTQYPIISSMAFGYGNTAANAEAAAKDSTSAAYSELGTKNLAGGTKRKYIVFAVEATDSGSGIDAVTMSAKGTDYALTFDAATAKYYTAAIDITTWGEGTHTLTFTAKDRAGLPTNGTKQFTVDLKGPVANLVSPASDSEVTGSITLQGSTTDENATVEEVKYVIGNNTIKNSADPMAAAMTAAKTAVCNLYAGASATAWRFDLDGTQANALNPGNEKLPSDPTGLASISGYETQSGSEIYRLPVYIYARDSLGNESISIKETNTPFTILYNPYGDRPKVEISYPVGNYTDFGGATPSNAAYNKTYVSNYSNISGSLRVTGSAVDNVSMTGGKVWIQLDVNNDGKFTTADRDIIKELKSNGVALYSVLEGLSAAKIPGLTDSSAITGSQNGEDNDFWGIEVKGTNSWSISINSANELQLASYNLDGTIKEQVAGTYITNNKYKVGIRAIAMDGSGVLGKWSTRTDAEYKSHTSVEDGGSYFMIDVNAPTIGTASFKNRILGAADAAGTITRTYVSDMYLSGTQTMIVPISDVTGIERVKYTFADSLDGLNANGISITSIDVGASGADGKLTDVSGLGATRKQYLLEIPVSVLNTSLGKNKIALKVIAEKSSATSYERYFVHFDNTAPSVEKLTFNGVTYNSTIPSTQKIVNSNTYFTIGGKAQDEGAGFERMAFYVYRESVALGKRIYDPMIAYVNGTPSANQANFINVEGSGIKTREVKDTTSGASEKIYGKEQTLTIASDGVTVSGYSADSHINSGSLVEIGGVWYKISNISGPTITLSSATTLTGSQTVFFAYIMSIDNTETEVGTGATETRGDGDKMIESVIKSNTEWEYDARFYSNYITDGPGTLFTYVWDKAGNVTVKSYGIKVENNAPRLTKLWLATDLSGDNNFSADEFTEYNILAKTNGNEQISYEMNTGDFGVPRFRVLDQLAVVTEFVGGNGDITCSFNTDATNPVDNGMIKKDAALGGGNTAPWINASDIGVDGTVIHGVTASPASFTASTYAGSLLKSNKAYIISNNNLNDGGSDSTKNLDGSFTKRQMSFTFWDSTEDTVQGDTSCYCYLKLKDMIVLLNDNEAPNACFDPFFWESQTENSLYENSYLNGHIDLSKDLMAAAGSMTYMDPKVSGIVSLQGTACDAHRLNEIWVNMDNFTISNGLSGATIGASAGTGYACVAKFDTGVWTCATAATVSGGNVNFQILEQKTTQEGHWIKWQLDVDTSNMSTGCGNDTKVYMIVRDKAWIDAAAANKDNHISSSTPSAGTIPGSEVYSSYEINVPYYQMDVVPYISKVQDANGNDAARSRLGKYPVRAGQTIKVVGFNFPTGNPSVIRTKSDGAAGETITVGVTRVSSTTVTFKAPEKSGYIKLDWGSGVETPNNDNTNAGYNISEGFISNEEDISHNKTWGRIAANKNGTNFWTDDVYLSVWSVGGYLDKSYYPISGTIDKYDDSNNAKYKFKNGGNWYGDNGNNIEKNQIVGIWAANDRMMHDALLGKPRENNICHQANNVFESSPDDTDMCLINNVPFYVILDNGVTGSGDWKGGLLIMRDGQTYQQFIQSAGVVEKQGNGNVETPDSSDGYDEMQFQFQNPKITGYYDASYYYVYISYYDAHARCLKYAEYRFNNTAKPDGNYHDITTLAKTEAAPKLGKCVVAGWDTLSTNPSYQEQVGEWSDIKMKGDKPVIVFYNKTKGCLEIATGKKTTPVSGRVDGVDSTPAGDGWYRNVLSTPNGTDFGRYVSMEIDSSNNLYIVAQDVKKGRLYYGKVSSTSYGTTNSKIDVNWTVVDSTDSVGRWTDIKLDSNNKPYVTYMNAAKLNTTDAVKVAYLEGTEWECITDPANYEASDQKLSIVLNTYDFNNKDAKLAVGMNAEMFGIDFLRDE